MKKFVSGVIVGLLLFSGASVFADSVNLVGQKVQGLFSVEKGGKKIADAVIINGSTYAPVKALADATGAKLDVKGKTITVQENESGGTASTGTSIASSTKLENFKNKRALVSYEISKREAGIKGTEEDTIPFHEKLAEELANNGTLGQQHRDAVISYKKVVEKMKAELVTLKQQLTDLDSQIAELQK